MEKNLWVITSDKLELKKSRIKRKIKESDLIENKVMIKELLYMNALDRYISNMKCQKIMTNSTGIISKGYLNSCEHFLFVLDNFITYFYDIFTCNILNTKVVGMCLAEDKKNLFLSNKYMFDNDNIKYYRNIYNNLIVENFYYNAKKLSNYLEEYYTEIDLDISKTKKSNLDFTLNLLEKLVFINRNSYKVMYLFKRIEDDEVEKYVYEWECLLSKYINNKEFIKHYQNFKNNI